MHHTLRTLLGDHPATRAVRRGALRSDAFSFDFADVPVPNKAFKRVVRDVEFDVAELALMTFLMARSRDVPLRMLPVVVFSRNPLPHFVCDIGRRVVPDQLRGSRIGVRAYTTTTAVWVRALMADRFGTDFDQTKWITLDEGHVAGVTDPAAVLRAGSGADLIAMLRDGITDAAIVDPVPADPRFVPVAPDPEGACRAWQDRHQARTLNHVIVVRETIAEDAELVRELFRLFRASRESAGDEVDRDATPIGLEDNRRSLEIAIAVADAQGLLAHPLSVDDLVPGAVAAIQ